MISCAQNQPNLAIFYEDALSCTSVSNFFSLACHFWLIICYGSWAKFLLCLEQGVRYISAIWLGNDVVWKWTYYKGYAEPRLKLFMWLCSVLPSALVLWQGCSYFPSCGYTVRVFQASLGYMGYWEIRSESSQLVYWTCEMPHRQCQLLVCLGVQGRAWEKLQVIQTALTVPQWAWFQTKMSLMDFWIPVAHYGDQEKLERS